MAFDNSFQVLGMAQRAATQAVRLVQGVGGRLGSVADQVVSASVSVPLNLAEGAGRSGKDRMQHYRVAYGSAREASAGVALLQALGAVDASGAGAVLGLLDQVQAITWRLTHPR